MVNKTKVAKIIRKNGSRIVDAVALATILLLATTSGIADGTTVPTTPTDPLAIHQMRPSQLSAHEVKEWYERGFWPVIGPTLALIITNAVTIYVVYLQSSRSFDALLRQRQIEHLAASLNEFYNPLVALLDINKAIFEQTGPPSFPTDEIARNAAGLVWKKTKQKILVNNAQIELILRTKTHLLSKQDLLSSYNKLLVHVAMYETFQEVETDLYKKFLFPEGIRAHIESKRRFVVDEYNKIAGVEI